MTWRLASILFIQVLYATVGAGLLPLLRIAPTRGLVLRRIGLAYMVGVAVTGILAAHLALLGVPVGLLELTLLALAVAFLGVRRLRGAEPRERLVSAPLTRLDWASAGLAAAAGAALVVLLGYAATAFAARPLREWDGWAIWATKARALYEFGGVHEPVFTTYQPVAHPILLPSLEAIGFRAMGAFDGALLHVQLIALAAGFAAALWALLRDRVPAGVIAVGLLAVLAAPAVLEHLSTNLADVPLAFFVALGAVSLGRFLVTREPWPLVSGALFLGAATLTKSEGLLFAAAVLVAAAVVLAATHDWRGLAGVGIAGAVTLVILVPWRIYLAVHDLRNPEYALSDALRPGYLADRTDRVSPAASRLWHELWAARWGYLLPLALIAVAAALAARRYRLAAFALLWPALAFLGLVLVYWISVVPIELTLAWTARRIVATIVIGTAALAPLLVGEAWPRAATSGAAGRPGKPASAGRAP